MPTRKDRPGAGPGESSGAASGTCLNPAHASGPRDACAGCCAEAEAEVTALRDRLMRRYRFEREWERDVAAMLSARYRSEADLLARTSLGDMDSLLSPVRAIAERAARIDPGMAYARQRALFGEFQAAARYDTGRFREEAGRAREDAVRLWQAYTTENRQLRGILANLAAGLHADRVRACGKQPGQCRCDGCQLARVAALVPVTLAKDGLPDLTAGDWFGHVTVTFNDRARQRALLGRHRQGHPHRGPLAARRRHDQGPRRRSQRPLRRGDLPRPRRQMDSRPVGRDLDHPRRAAGRDLPAPQRPRLPRRRGAVRPGRPRERRPLVPGRALRRH
jgi:hypothetical protein